MSVWDDTEFAKKWNDAYGLDMSKAPLRSGVIYPLLSQDIKWPQSSEDKIRIADFGCGNGNWIRAFRDRPFVEWLGIDNGSAILESAYPLAENTNVSFLKRDIGQEVPELRELGPFDHAVSIFTLEEMAAEKTNQFFKNMAQAVCSRAGQVHIFTQHPTYAFYEDVSSLLQLSQNRKFEGLVGYFDTKPSTYSLAQLNSQKGVSEKPDYHHKTFAMIMNGLAQAGLSLQYMLEIPQNVLSLEVARNYEPRCGSVPRFLYLRAQAL